jgi:hypothetical protein
MAEAPCSVAACGEGENAPGAPSTEPSVTIPSPLPSAVAALSAVVPLVSSSCQ